jgi:hypothetical protein
MSRHDDLQEAKSAFHIAKLALFNVRLLNDLQIASVNNREVASVIGSPDSPRTSALGRVICDGGG